MNKDKKDGDKKVKILKYLKIFFHELSDMIEENNPLSCDYDYEIKNKEYDDYTKMMRK